MLSSPKQRPFTQPSIEVPSASGMDRQVRTTRFKRSNIVAACLLTLAIAISAAGYAKYGLVRTAKAPADQLTFATVHRGLFQDYAPATGNVAPRVSVFLDSIDGGKVDRVLVDQGSVVQA
ncbi:MAG: efflux RND transporter periplasmic adaptor subunit, partial [Alphaproteobacteria bacterium]